MRFGRKRQQDPGTNEAEAALDAALGAIERGELPEFAEGPYDFAQEAERHGFVYLPDHRDLGSLLLPPTGDIVPSLRGDAATGEVESVVLTRGEGELELSVYSAVGAPGISAEARAVAADQVRDQGGTCTEQPGPFGPELSCHVPVVTETGESTSWRARIVLVDGPDWYLQAMLQETLADSPEEARPFEEILRRVFVRGDPTVPAGERLPLGVAE